jgi:predicted esterase
LKPHAGQPLLSAGTPVEESHAAMILVHGRNAGPADILSLVPALNRRGFAYLAPAAANGTWYPYSFLTETAKNQPGISSGLFVLDHLVKDLVARGIPRKRIMLLGFSQGACLSAEFAVRNADRFGGVIIFSGGLIGPLGTRWQNPGSFQGTPIFLGCSDVDAHIPKQRVEESAAVFERMSASVTLRLYPGMGHLVSDD